MNNTVTLEDLRMLEGRCYRTTPTGTYPTVKGRVLEQIIADSIFSAYAHKAENENTPAHDRIEDLEATASPYKDGIDASLAEQPDLPETAGKKPRPDLLFDILKEEDVDPEATMKLVEAIKERAIESQVMRITKRTMGSGSGGSTNVRARIARGLLALEEMDESWDDAFITRAANFIVEYTDRTNGEHDVNNLAFLKGVLEGIPVDEDNVVPMAKLKFAI